MAIRTVSAVAIYALAYACFSVVPVGKFSLWLFPLHSLYYLLSVADSCPNFPLWRGLPTLVALNFGEGAIALWVLGRPMNDLSYQIGVFVCILLTYLFVPQFIVFQLKNNRVLVTSAEAIYKGLRLVRALLRMTNPAEQLIAGTWKFTFSSLVQVTDAKLTGNPYANNHTWYSAYRKAVQGFLLCIIAVALTQWVPEWPGIEDSAYFCVSAIVLYSYYEKALRKSSKSVFE